MPTSTAGPSTDARARARHAHPAGFTLIEISLVLLIIAIMVALAVPRLRSASGAELKREARQLTNTFRFLRSEAILNGQIYQLRYDLGRERYWVTVGDPTGEAGLGTADDLEDLGPLARSVTLTSPIGISDIVLPESVGKQQEGQFVTNFYPDGTVDTTVIHLDDGSETYTLWVNPLTGRLNLDPGYSDVVFEQ
ncbi:MAG: GspH/FimT family pseudopilin [Deltaproteobacteria bacterium]|nr:GspH/FimT family pseudopilin [Deltaproteobacteria bacterium]MBI3389949.1 GspH/FimT family pseudopilin [Deltaproteobacteria bacterium]